MRCPLNPVTTILLMRWFGRVLASRVRHIIETETLKEIGKIHISCLWKSSFVYIPLEEIKNMLPLGSQTLKCQK